MGRNAPVLNPPETRYKQKEPPVSAGGSFCRNRRCLQSVRRNKPVIRCLHTGQNFLCDIAVIPLEAVEQRIIPQSDPPAGPAVAFFQNLQLDVPDAVRLAFVDLFLRVILSGGAVISCRIFL